MHQLVRSADSLCSLDPTSPDSPSPKRSRVEKGQGDCSTSNTLDGSSTRDTTDCDGTPHTIDCSTLDAIGRSTLDPKDCSIRDTINRSTQDTAVLSTVGNSGDRKTQDEDRKRNLLTEEEEFCEEVFRAGDVENAEWQIQLARNYLRWMKMIQNR